MVLGIRAFCLAVNKNHRIKRIKKKKKNPWEKKDIRNHCTNHFQVSEIVCVSHTTE